MNFQVSESLTCNKSIIITLKCLFFNKIKNTYNNSVYKKLKIEVSILIKDKKMIRRGFLRNEIALKNYIYILYIFFKVWAYI